MHPAYVRTMLLLIFASIALSTPVLAQQIENAQAVSFLKAEIIQSGAVNVVGNVQKLEVNLTIPQEDSWQKIQSIEVSVPYSFVTDKLGNRLLVLSWNNPPAGITNFTVKTIVSVDRRTSATLPYASELSQPGELVQSADPEIVSLAQQVSRGSTDYEKISSAAAWVHDNIKYDLAYANVNLSAKETLQKKAGVCDEFSTLLISLARALHYRAAYVVGYAYGEGYRTENAFVPHGWTEICGSDCYVFDPTWPEGGSLDATHIKFIALPDSMFIQASLSAIGTGNFSAKFEPVNSLERLETKITILESRSSPPITSTSTLLDGELWTGYAVMKTDMSDAGCALTSVKSSSCLSQGKQFIPSLTPDRTVSFCNSRTLFTIFQLPTGLSTETRYNCELSIIPSAGTRNDANVVLVADAAPTGSIELMVDSTSLKPSETFGVTAPGAMIFTDTGLYTNDSARWTAPSTGFTVYAYRDGLLQSQAIAVNGEAPPKVQTPAPEIEKPSEPAGVPENPPASLPEKSFFDKLIDAITNFFSKLFGR